MTDELNEKVVLQEPSSHSVTEQDTEVEKLLRRAFAAESFEATYPRPNCPETVDLVTLIQLGIGYSRHNEVMPHVLDCAYCRSAFTELRSALRAADAVELTEAIPESIECLAPSGARVGDRPTLWQKIALSVVRLRKQTNSFRLPTDESWRVGTDDRRRTPIGLILAPLVVAGVILAAVVIRQRANISRPTDVNSIALSGASQPTPHSDPPKIASNNPVNKSVSPPAHNRVIRGIEGKSPADGEFPIDGQQSDASDKIADDTNVTPANPPNSPSDQNITNKIGDDKQVAQANPSVTSPDTNAPGKTGDDKRVIQANPPIIPSDANASTKTSDDKRVAQTNLPVSPPDAVAADSTNDAVAQTHGTGDGLMNLQIAGGWVEKTSGSGTDQVYYVATWVKTKIVKDDGVDRNTVIDHGVEVADAGLHNDHGGPSTQQLPKCKIFAQPLNKGETITMLVSMYSTSDGGLLQKSEHNLLGQLDKIADGALDSGKLYVAGGAEVAKIVAPILQASMTSERGLVGSIKVWFTKMPNGENNWDTQAYAGATLFQDCPKDDAGHPTWLYSLTGNGHYRVQIQPIGPSGVPARLN